MLAIDIGGTKIAAAVVDAEGTILTDQLRPTAVSDDPEVVFAGVESAVRGLLAELEPTQRPDPGRHLLRRTDRRTGRHHLPGQHRRLAGLPDLGPGSAT